MAEAIDQATALIRAGIAEIDKEEAQLRRTLANLGGDSNSTQRKASIRPKRRRAPKRAKKGQRLDEVSAILKSNPNAKTAEIARQIGISSNQVSALKAKLAKEQKKQAPRVRSNRRAKKGAKKNSRGKAKAKASKARKASTAKTAKK